MKKLFILALVLVFTMSLMPQQVTAADKINVCIVDSGSDFTHELLAPVAQANEKELKGKKDVDDDGNGYIDDTFGWNFTDNSNVIVHLEFTPPMYDDLLTFLEYMGIYQAEGRDGLTPDQFNFLVKNYKDPEFMKWVGFTGGWAHGTHVAGIVTQDNKDVQLKAISHIPTGGAPQFNISHMLAPMTLDLKSKGETTLQQPPMEAFEAQFKSMGQNMAKECIEESKYLASLNPRVINCSFGSSNKALLQSFKQNMTQSWGFSDPTDAQVQEMVNLFVKNAMNVRDKEFFKRVPNALIVIAAGNSTEDNDNLVISPNDVDLTNTLVIAATNKDKEIAGFSCFGKTTVDVGTPGVGIFSSYPNGKMGFMSGTSMAAPLAARYCAMTLRKNPELTPQELKKIIMGTVDKKEWLKDKVISGGVINVKRAQHAAKLTAEGVSVSKAIMQAGTKVEDAIKASPFDLFKPVTFETQMEKDLYFSTVF